MAEVVCDSKTFTIALIEDFVDAKIISYSFPPSAKKGDEINGTVTIQNTGNALVEVRAYLIDADSNSIINKEPDTYYKNLSPGETVTFQLGTSWDPMWAMPDHDWNLRLEARRQT